jgi:DNA repair exonuclease SbcCD ATPase subunit
VIVFSKLTFKNFLSVGNTPVTINLNDHKTTLIYGTNGSGKSTILDAICYALFNKPFRTINLPQLVNSANKKDLLVEIEFTIGKTEYIVARGMKPKKFKIYRDGEELDAKASDKDNQAYLEQNILKMNLKTFIQVVILGSGNYMPFMKLSAAARRECVEEFLDIKVFTAMSLLAKERLRSYKDKNNEVKGDISTLEYKIGLQEERIVELRDRSKADLEELKNKIEEYKQHRQDLQVRIEELQQEDQKILSESNALMVNSPKKVSTEYSNVIAKLDGKLERLKKELDFYKNHDECPNCNQSIDKDIKDKALKTAIEESQKIIKAREQASSKLRDIQSILNKILEKEEEAYKVQQESYKLNERSDLYQRQIIDSENKIVSISTSTSNIDKEMGKLDGLNEQLVELKKKSGVILNQIKDHEIVVNLLKDSGIKTQIVRKYLPVMNKSIRKYLTSLDFPVLFMLDEQFSETVASPAYQDFSYPSFSEGQKSRIDLALMFTWREIGKLKNSVSTNLLILDEVFSSSLDEGGKEHLLALLRYGMEDNQNIVVVDHTLSDAFKEKFDNSVEVSKVKGFSRYSTS